MFEQPLSLSSERAFELQATRLRINCIESKQELRELYMQLFEFHLHYKTTTEALLRQHWGINADGVNQRTTTEER